MHPDIKAYCAKLDFELILHSLLQQIALPGNCIFLLALANLLVVQGIAAGLTLFEIACLIVRMDDEDQPSKLELTIEEAEDNAFRAIELRASRNPSNHSFQQQPSSSRQSSAGSNEDSSHDDSGDLIIASNNNSVDFSPGRAPHPTSMSNSAGHSSFLPVSVSIPDLTEHFQAQAQAHQNETITTSEENITGESPSSRGRLVIAAVGDRDTVGGAWDLRSIISCASASTPYGIPSLSPTRRSSSGNNSNNTDNSSGMTRFSPDKYTRSPTSVSGSAGRNDFKSLFLQDVLTAAYCDGADIIEAVDSGLKPSSLGSPLSRQGTPIVSSSSRNPPPLFPVAAESIILPVLPTIQEERRHRGGSTGSTCSDNSEGIVVTTTSPSSLNDGAIVVVAAALPGDNLNTAVDLKKRVDVQLRVLERDISSAENSFGISSAKPLLNRDSDSFCDGDVPDSIVIKSKAAAIPFPMNWNNFNECKQEQVDLTDDNEMVYRSVGVPATIENNGVRGTTPKSSYLNLNASPILMSAMNNHLDPRYYQLASGGLQPSASLGYENNLMATFPPLGMEIRKLRSLDPSSVQGHRTDYMKNGLKDYIIPASQRVNTTIFERSNDDATNIFDGTALESTFDAAGFGIDISNSTEEEHPTMAVLTASDDKDILNQMDGQGEKKSSRLVTISPESSTDLAAISPLSAASQYGKILNKELNAQKEPNQTDFINGNYFNSGSLSPLTKLVVAPSDLDFAANLLAEDQKSNRFHSAESENNSNTIKIDDQSTYKDGLALLSTGDCSTPTKRRKHDKENCDSTIDESYFRDGRTVENVSSASKVVTKDNFNTSIDFEELMSKPPSINRVVSFSGFQSAPIYDLDKEGRFGSLRQEKRRAIVKTAEFNKFRLQFAHEGVLLLIQRASKQKKSHQAKNKR